MGGHVSLCLAQDIYKEKSRVQMVTFLKCLLKFYIEAAMQVKTNVYREKVSLRLLYGVQHSVISNHG